MNNDFDLRSLTSW